MKVPGVIAEAPAGVPSVPAKGLGGSFPLA